ncbi:MAG: AAA family ATPase [Candidatus Aenigmatarchaeota archaeon]
MITRVSLKGWKSHLDSELEFSKGVNAIIGIMGSGKTSVMDGISFALYGNFPALQSRKVTISDLIMKKPQRKSKAEIELVFSVNGNSYSIKRVIEERGTTVAEIRKDGRLVDVNPQNVTKQVEKILQMDYELFSRAVYSEQNGLDYFLRVPKGQRMQQIDSMLKVDQFEDVRESCVSLANRIANSVKEKARIVSQLESEMLSERIENIVNEIDELKGKARPIKIRLESLKGEIESLSKRLSGFEGLETEANKKKRELDALNASIGEIVSSLENKKPEIKGKEGLDLKKEIAAVEDGIKNIEEDIRGKRETLNGYREQIASIMARMEIVENAIKELEGIEAKCPVCESQITEERKKSLIKARRSERKAFDGELHSLEEKIIAVSGEIQALEKRLRLNISEREKLVHLESDIRLVREWERRLEEKKRERERVEAELKRMEEELSRTDIKKLRSELQEKAIEQREANVMLSSLREKILDREEMLRDLEKRNSLLKDYREEIERDRNAIESLNTFVGVLRATQEQLREEFLKNVNRIMSAVWNEIYPYADFTGIRLVVDKDYVLQLKGSEGWINVDGIASGGERSMACLALRIAFSLSFIPNLRWLILDEPTHNLDSNAINQFIEVLREKMPSFVEQVFLITHDERISEGVQGAEGVLYKLERNKNENGATFVRRWE